MLQIDRHANSWEDGAEFSLVCFDGVRRSPSASRSRAHPLPYLTKCWRFSAEGAGCDEGERVMARASPMTLSCGRAEKRTDIGSDFRAVPD
jgi:hypothetical protein